VPFEQQNEYLMHYYAK